MIGILLIATRKYKQFVQPLFNQIDNRLFEGRQKTIFLFTDELRSDYRSENKIQQFQIPSYSFPYATLYRYRVFTDHEKSLSACTHLYYFDVDMAIVSPVRNEFLVDGLAAVRHPGFFISDKWGSEGNPEMSTSWFPKEHRKHYYAGGVQGGKTEHYLEAVKIMAERIDEDESNGVIAVYHDETHWNRYANFDRPELVTEFDPSYCMVEQEHLRKSWGIDHLEPKIIALSKNHQEIRS